jgi:iron-sulfur cluster repair protein YtfE (RIC family)
MNITEALLGEHAVLYDLFNHLERTSPTLSLSELIGRGSLLGAVLASHAKLEEELLFSRLEEVVGYTGPLKAMRREHGQIDGALERLAAADDTKKARQLLYEVIHEARNHFAKEERLLFPMAANTLSKDALCGLGARWAANRSVALA